MLFRSVVLPVILMVSVYPHEQVCVCGNVCVREKEGENTLILVKVCKVLRSLAQCLFVRNERTRERETERCTERVRERDRETDKRETILASSP